MSTQEDQPDAPDKPLLTQQRVDALLAAAKKKVDAALAHVPGMHFRVYPPQEFLDHPAVLEEAAIYAKLKSTSWWVKWHDGSEDQLLFLDFLAFIDQIEQSEKAAQAAMRKHHTSMLGISHRQSKHSGGWQVKKDRSKKAAKRKGWHSYKVTGGIIDPAALILDEKIRELLKAVHFERSERPREMMN